MRSRLRPSPAMVMASVALFVALGGTGLAATYVLSSNKQVAPNVISGHKPPSGDHPNVIAGSVNGMDLAAGVVSTNKLAANAVRSAKVVNGAITNPKLGPNAVTSDKIQNNSIVGYNDIAPNTVQGTQIDESTLNGVDATYLGGQPASSYARGGIKSGTLVSLAVSDAPQDVLTVPGFGRFAAYCTSPVSTRGINFTYYNSSNATQDVAWSYSGGNVAYYRLPPDQGLQTGYPQDAELATYQVSGDAGTMTATVSGGWDSSSSKCRFQGQAIWSP